jgi:hypothetical protein
VAIPPARMEYRRAFNSPHLWTSKIFWLAPRPGLPGRASAGRAADPWLEGLLEDPFGDAVAAVDVVQIAVHQHFGLDDRDDPSGLAERRIATERLGVGWIDVCVGMSAPMSITARHFAKRTPWHNTGQPVGERRCLWPVRKRRRIGENDNR